MSTQNVKEALDHLMAQYVELPPFEIQYDPDWPSECYLHTTTNLQAGEHTQWQPVAQQSSNDMFLRLEEALEERIHPDLATFYTSYWSDPLPATCEHGDLSLIQVWNEEDMERLRGNLIGHALSKRDQKRPLTFFIACPEPDDNYFISIDNFSGEIWLERPGKPPIRKLADNLAEFLSTLTPKQGS